MTPGLSWNCYIFFSTPFIWLCWALVAVCGSSFPATELRVCSCGVCVPGRLSVPQPRAGTRILLIAGWTLNRWPPGSLIFKSQKPPAWDQLLTYFLGTTLLPIQSLHRDSWALQPYPPLSKSGVLPCKQVPCLGSHVGCRDMTQGLAILAFVSPLPCPSFRDHKTGWRECLSCHYWLRTQNPWFNPLEINLKPTYPLKGYLFSLETYSKTRSCW